MRSSQRPPALAVVLFDIDGTLIRRAGPHHRRALEEAVLRVTGLRTSTDPIPTQGMLDRDILAAMMRDAGASLRLIRQSMPAIVERAQRIYAQTCPDLRRKVCPGVRSLLQRLQQRRVPAGLVSGNLSRIAWKKMDHAGLRPFFSFGAFAEAGRTRAALARLAVRVARQEGWVGRSTPISLIGDHPNDILAARANSLRSIAVATGVVPAGELQIHRPDILLEDLRKLKLEMILDA